MANADETITPKGLFLSRVIATHLSYFSANYKGGRNESFMYGWDRETNYYDYDLTTAYTTIITLLPYLFTTPLKS
jgi:hypothetical protein